MANKNQNTGPSLSGDSTSAREQAQRSEKIRKDQGDYLNLIKDTESALKKVIGAYETIEGKLNALNKGSINLREISKAVYKENERRQILLSREKNLGKDINEYTKKYLENLAKNKNISQEDLDIKISKLSADKQAYFNVQKALLLANEGVEFANQRLDIEKKTNSNIGLTGRLLGKIGQTLGGNNEVYEEMVEESRRLIETTGKGLTFSEKVKYVWQGVKSGIKASIEEVGGLGKAITIGVLIGFKKLLDLTGSFAKGIANATADFMAMSGDQVIGKLTSGISSIVGKIPILGGVLSGIVEGFGKLLELSLKEDDTITKIGRELGVSKVEAGRINDEFLKISLNSGKALISSRALVESQKELANELGVTNILSGEILTTNIELAKLGGVDAKTRASIAQSSIITDQSAKSITESVLGQVAGLKAATGISFNYQKILAQASSLGGTLGLQFAKYPEKLTKALVTTKSLGLELSKLDSMANSFLDFESSISKEFEAQLLTGKDINLAKAREAFLNNDLATAAAEITRQTGSASDFLKMNRIQQESIADSMGMSRDEMAEMLKQQEIFSKLGAKDLKDAQAKVEALKAQGKSRAEIAKLIGEEAYQNITNASAQEKIAGFLDKVQSALANFLSKSPIVPLIERAIDFLSKPENITGIIQKIQGVFATIFDVVGGVAASIMKVANVFGADIDTGLIKKAKSGGDFIRGLDLGGSSVSVSDAAMNSNLGRSYQGGSSQNVSSPPIINNQIHFKGEIVDTASNIQGRLNKGVYAENTNLNG